MPATSDPISRQTGPAGAAPIRSRSWRDWYVVALCTGAAAFALGPSLVGARTLVSVNFLTDFLPAAAGGNRSVGHELCQSDTVDSVMPSVAYVRHQIFSGHLGSWQSLTQGGGPLSALPNAGLLDPLSLPFWILPPRWAPAFVALLCWVVAIGGTFLFLRRLSVGRPAATLAGFVFATSGFMVMWTNWPQTRTAALIPVLFWATDRIVTRARPADVVLLAAVVASMLFGGFPAVTGYALYMAGGYFAVRTLMVHGRDWAATGRRVGLAAAGVVLGGGLSAVQMLPFVDFYRVLPTAYRTGEAKQGLPLGGLVTTFAPNVNGLCVVGKSGAPADYGSLNPVELVAYVGAAAVILAVVGAAFAIVSRRWNQKGVRGYFAAACVAVAVLGWASPTARSAVAHLPVFANNFIGRARSVLGFGLAVLAAFGFDWLTSRPGRAAPDPADPADPAEQTGRSEQPGPPPGPRRAGWSVPAMVWPVAVIAASLIAGAVILRAGHRDAFSGQYLHAWKHAIWIPAVLLVASAAVAAAAIFRRAGAGAAFVVLPVLVVAQGTAFFHTVMPGDDPGLFYPASADHRYLAAHLGHDRFAPVGLTLYTAGAYYDGLRSATGHSFTSSTWTDLLAAVDPHVMASPTNSNFTGGLSPDNVARQPILDRMGVRYVVMPPADVAGAQEALPDTPGRVAAGSTPLACSLAGGPIRGVTVRTEGVLTASRPPTYPTVHVRVSSGSTTLESGLYLDAAQTPAGTTISVPVAGEGLRPGAPLRVSLWATGSGTPLVLAGSGGSAACAAVRPTADGLKLVLAEPGAVIYERLTALPRIRWASDTRVIAAASGRLAALKRDMPASQVILSAPGPAGGGGPAAVTVTQDDGDRIAARVDATTAGYLVVADPMQMPGWSVTVDGRKARLVHADYAMVAVAVPAGRHGIALTYTAPGQVAGAVVTGAGLAAAAALLWWDLVAAPRRRRRGGRAGPGPNDATREQITTETIH